MNLVSRVYIMGLSKTVDKRPHYPCSGLMNLTFVLSLVVLFWNDHYWKGVGPEWITGKLSDVVILVVAPLTLQAILEVLLSIFRFNWGPNRKVLIFSCVLMGLIMALINIWEPASWCYLWGLGTLQWPFRAAFSLITDGELIAVRSVQLTVDPTDIWTIPSIGIPLYKGWGRTTSK